MQCPLFMLLNSIGSASEYSLLKLNHLSLFKTASQQLDFLILCLCMEALLSLL